MLFPADISSVSGVDASVMVDLFLENRSRRLPLDCLRPTDCKCEDGSDPDIRSNAFTRSMAALLDFRTAGTGVGDVALAPWFILMMSRKLLEWRQELSSPNIKAQAAVRSKFLSWPLNSLCRDHMIVDLNYAAASNLANHKVEDPEGKRTKRARGLPSSRLHNWLVQTLCDLLRIFALNDSFEKSGGRGVGDANLAKGYCPICLELPSWSPVYNGTKETCPDGT